MKELFLQLKLPLFRFSLNFKVPLFAVMTEDIGLRGARVCAEREYNAM